MQRSQSLLFGALSGLVMLFPVAAMAQRECYYGCNAKPDPTKEQTEAGKAANAPSPASTLGAARVAGGGTGGGFDGLKPDEKEQQKVAGGGIGSGFDGVKPDDAFTTKSALAPEQSSGGFGAWFKSLLKH